MSKTIEMPGLSQSIEIPGFEISHLIARGGMAAVYAAKQKSLGREVALKIMDAKQNDPSFTERFLNEGRLIATLHHPNVITIHDLGVLPDDRAFISMEYIDGGDLEAKLRHQISEREAISILRQLAECLKYIHDNDVVHRDIKPANILFRRDGSLVLTDFGIAKQLDTDVKLTRDGVAVGSPGYMSPEQAQAHSVDNRSDIYAVGVIFAEMLMGKNTFEADSHIQTSMNHIQMEIPILPLNQRRYQGLLNKMLAKNPGERFNDAQALLEYIDKIPGIEEIEALEEEAEEQEEIVHEIEKEKPKKGLFALIFRNDRLIFFIFLIMFCVGGFYFFQFVQFKTKVDDFNKQAERALKEDRLMLPEDSSAYYFFNEALKMDPENPRAKEGIGKIADRYVSLAEYALSNGQKTKARNFIERGLTVDPDHARLKELQKR